MNTENKKPKNPNAFPCIDGSFFQEGMTLRDYFASKAMQGCYSSTTMSSCTDKDLENDSKMFYRIADAMLKAREDV